MSDLKHGADFVRELEARSQRLEASNQELMHLMQCPDGYVPVSREALRNIAIMTIDADVVEAIDETLSAGVVA